MSEEKVVKSCLDFSREEIRELEDSSVTDISDEDLIKILIRRGEENKNPIIQTDCENLLKKINREPFFNDNKHKKFNRKHRGGYKGRYRNNRRNFHKNNEQNNNSDSDE